MVHFRQAIFDCRTCSILVGFLPHPLKCCRVGSLMGVWEWEIVGTFRYDPMIHSQQVVIMISNKAQWNIVLQNYYISKLTGAVVETLRWFVFGVPELKLLLKSVTCLPHQQVAAQNPIRHRQQDAVGHINSARFGEKNMWRHPTGAKKTKPGHVWVCHHLGNTPP